MTLIADAVPELGTPKDVSSIVNEAIGTIYLFIFL